MAPILQIDTSLWATSGAATELSTRGGAATGLLSLDANWTHGVDSEGRKYIEHANTGGSDNSISIIAGASIFGSVGDRVRVQAGIMLIKNSTIDYTGLSISSERFFDTAGGERTILSLRHGTDFFDGEAYRFQGAEFGATATIDDISSLEGLQFGNWYEIAADCLYDNPGWVRFHINGVPTNAIDADMTGTTPDNIKAWKIPDVPDNRVTYRLYGDRDGYIQVIGDDFEYLPQYNLESSSALKIRPIDMQSSDIATDRGFWIWDDISEAVSTKYATGGTNPARRRIVVSATGATGSLREPFESSASDKKNMFMINGILMNPGGTLEIVFTTDSTELGRIIFTGGDLQIKHGVSAAQDILTYDTNSRYCLRLNRYGNKLRVGLENLSEDFTSSSNIQYADISITNTGGLATSHYEDIDLIASDCEIDGVVGMDIEFSGLVSSFVSASTNGLVPLQATSNRIWNRFPTAKSYYTFPGLLANDYDLSQGYTFTTLGRSGNNLTNFVTNNLSKLALFTGHTLILLEWIINDLSPVRGDESNTIAKRAEILSSLESLVDACIENNISIRVGKAVPPPLEEGANNWPQFSLDAYDWLNTNAEAMLEDKDRPDLVYWSNVDTTTDNYYTGATDDIHFNTAGDFLYANNFIANLSSIGILLANQGRVIPVNIPPSAISSPTFTVNGLTYTTRVIDTNIESMIVQTEVSGPVVVIFESVGTDHEIRYTVNGKNVTSKSKLYDGSIVLTRNLSGSDNTIIKSRIYNKDNPNIHSRMSRLMLKVT